MHTQVVKIEIATESENLDEITEIIKKHSCTGHKGDGIIFVTEIEQATRIRDGKQGADILN